jgi:hypothetical protein
MPQEPSVYLATLFDFSLQPDETESCRIVRCCQNALDVGPMGRSKRPEFYRDFIACNQERTKAKADVLATVKTSCALFVRAVRRWCGAPPTGPYRIGTAMFTSMGKVSFRHAAFVEHDESAEPNPGDYFYIASSRKSNDGHTGIFIERIDAGVWRTAEGGGGDGTECAFRERRIAGKKFSRDRRTLWGWFDCAKVGLPASPVSEGAVIKIA